MQDILRHINSVEGVIGSAVFNEKGVVLSHVFPPLIDVGTLNRIAELTLECIHGLQVAQTLEIIDLRYVEGRVLIKPFPGALLCLLCAKNVNLQVLAITLNLAVKKLEPKLPSGESDVLLEEQGENSVLNLKISHLTNREASSSFDSLGMIAISQPTSACISDFYKAPFKKLILTNTSAGTNGTFAVMVMKDIDPQFDSTIIVGPSIEKKLKVSEGDMVEIRLI